ncbi:MAG: dTDP-4-dehydrorhamnose 3,5-epimerase family protein [Planctomycetota bacterium]
MAPIAESKIAADSAAETLTPLSIAGAFLLTPHVVEDDRGSFTRLWCGDLAGRYGLPTTIDHYSRSVNRRVGTLRGMHYQIAPHDESKWVRCAAGSIWDVLLDLRPTSPSYRHWAGVELSADNDHQVYVPPGVAHGFLTLADQSVVHYAISGRYHPAAARGIRWNDPAFEISWPAEPTTISPRDANYPLFYDLA